MAFNFRRRSAPAASRAPNTRKGTAHKAIAQIHSSFNGGPSFDFATIGRWIVAVPWLFKA